MKTLERWLAAWACVGMLIGPAGAVRSADPPSARQSSSKSPVAEQHLDLAYIPATAFAALVVHPQAALARPQAQSLPKEIITAAGEQEIGFDPLKVSEAVLMFAPPSRGPDPEVGVVLRFAEAYSKERVIAKLPRPKEVDIDGKTVLELTGRGQLSFCFPDDRTIVLGELPMLKQMLSAKEVDSPLVNLLKTLDVSAEVTGALSVEALRDLWHQALAHAPPLPPQFQGFLKLPDLLSAVLLRVRIDTKFRGELTLRARNAAAAEEVETLVNQGLAMGRQLLLAQIANMPRHGDDPVKEAGAHYLTRITNKVFGLVKPVRNGTDVSVSGETGASAATVGILIGLLLPAINAAREAANRNTDANKLRQIGLAMHNYESGVRRYPARAIFDKEGKPLLSWRVRILPLLGEDEHELYKQFHLDEPWDSEHNKPLIDKMPAVYLKSGHQNEGKTVFLVPVGKGLGFEGDKGITEGDLKDGSSHTILAVEGNDDRTVPWTKPDDLNVDLDKPLDGLGTAEAGGIFAVLFFDGHIQFLSNQIDPLSMKALFTRAGGEAIDPTQLDR